MPEPPPAAKPPVVFPRDAMLTAVLGTFAILALGVLLGFAGVAQANGPLVAFLVLAGGIGLVAALAAGALFTPDLPEGTRMLLGVLAGLVAVAGAIGLWFASIAAAQASYAWCGTAMALPAMGAMGGFLVFKEQLLHGWGVPRPT